MAALAPPVDLAAAQAAVQERLAATRRALHAVRMARTRQVRAAAEPCGRALRPLAVLVTMLADDDGTVAASYLQARRRRRFAFPGTSLTATRELVRRWRGHTVLAERNALLDPVTPAGRHRYQLAHEVVSEYNLWQWVRACNGNQGVAPTTSELLARYVRGWPWGAKPEVRHRAAEVAAMSPAVQRVWASRWRRRWGLRWARLRVTSDCTPEEVRAKARPPTSAAPLLGPFFGPIFGAAALSLLRGRPPIWGPRTGPPGGSFLASLGPRRRHAPTTAG